MDAPARDAAIAVLFDMDGVLVDSYAAHYESWRQTCERRGVLLPEAVFARGFGKTSVEFLRELWPRTLSAEECSAIEHEKELAYRSSLRDHFPEVPGARELVLDLAGDGIALAVGSSGPPENVAMVLDALRVRECFGAVVTGRDVLRGKPDPMVFQLAAERLRVPANRAIVIEDASVGITAAHAAGMRAIGYVGTGRTREELAAADRVVSSLRELTAASIRSLIE